LATMMRIAHRLGETRHARFVGREAEYSLFRELLNAETLPLQVLFVYGPGGIGKTTLAHEFMYACREAGVRAVYLDAREIEASPRGFCAALSAAGRCEASHPAPVEACRGPQREVLIVDTYEALAPLDAWLRETLLPQLPESVLVVLSGRNPPSRMWRTDPGWQSLLRPLPLRNLAPHEAQTYLANRLVPAEQRQAVQDFTHGHPLALSLVADAFAQQGEFQFDPDSAPDIVSALVSQFLDTVPSAEHRRALEICALVRATTEPLLARLLDVPDAHDLFEWMRGLSFVETGRFGLVPHDMAREALAANLRWRDADCYVELHRRARAYYGQRVQQTQGFEQQQVLFDYVFLHRDNPLMRPYLDWQENGLSMPDALRPGDEAALREMVLRQEGQESTAWLEYWIERQPECFVVYREPDGKPAGFLAPLSIEALPSDQRDDPAVHAAWRYLDTLAPLRAGERAILFRFWMSRDSYQQVCATQSLIFGRAAQVYLTTPGLAFSFFPTAEPQFWAPMFSHVDLPRLPQADFSVDGRRFGVFGHDWRARPPMAWLTLLGEREVSGAPEPARDVPVSSVVLSEPEFAAAVLDALRQFNRDDLLPRNALLRSRLICERSGPGASDAQRIDALRRQILDAAEGLKLSARDTRLWLALEHTYVHPAASQEQAAELLDLPFSTYRRYLKAAISRVTTLLWQRELGVFEQVAV